jgi:hypothetical protein
MNLRAKHPLVRVNPLIALGLALSHLVWLLPLRNADAAHTTSSTAHARKPAKHRYATKQKSRHTPRHQQSAAKHPSAASFPANVESTPAYGYAQLSRDDCHRELERRNLPVKIIEEPYTGLDAPTRLEGKLHEVLFRTDFDNGSNEPSVYSLIDCRLILGLDDFAKLLNDKGIVEVVYSSSYRPPPKSAPETKRGHHHAGGLAIDVHRLRSTELGWLSVEKDFHGREGSTVCGPHAQPPTPVTKNATVLRELVCGANERRLFQLILTPNYDRPHRNHFHLEVTPDVRWFIVS